MKSRLPFLFVIMTVMIDAMGIGLIMPVMPDLIRDLNGGSVSEAAVWGAALAFTYALMQFAFAPTFGNLSDAYGRRPVLLISLVVMGVDYIIMGFAGSIWLLFVARLISGITGATYSTANAFMADMSSPKDRAANFGLVGAGFGVGFILGPSLGGLLGQYGPHAPFFAAAILALSNAVFGYFVAPETLPIDKRRPFDWRAGNPFSALMRIRALPGIGSLILVLLIYMIASNVYPVIWSYYTQERFGWDVTLVGISLTVFGICMALVQGGLIRVLLARYQPAQVAIGGMMLNVCVFSLIVWVPTTELLFMLLPLSALGVVVTPAIQGIMSNAIADNRQGELQGVVSSVMAIASIAAPLLMPWLFRTFTKPDAAIYLPAAPFAASAVLTVVALLMFLKWQKT